MDPPTSLFDQFFARPRRPWVKCGLAALLFLAPLAAAYADHALGDLFRQGAWRGVFIPPTVIVYILFVSPRLARMESDMLRAFRPVVLVDDEHFQGLLSQEAHIKPGNEALLFAAGALGGLLTTAGSPGASFSCLPWVWRLSTALMYGVLAWTVYGSLASTRLTATLLRQPLRVDPFDTTPFEPMGRQSLLLELVFVGGITLSLPFAILQPGTLSRVEFWLVYLTLLSVPVIIFFLGMSPVHKVLAAARDRELQAVQQHLRRSCRELGRRLDQQQDTGSLPLEINALVTYDQRLQAAATWPYNTGMLRTLVFGVLIPGATVLAKIAVDVLID